MVGRKKVVGRLPGRGKGDLTLGQTIRNALGTARHSAGHWGLQHKVIWVPALEGFCP